MRLPIYQVDAFTSRLFRGNPAAVCPLVEWLPDEVLQSIARENNLSETAYYLKRRDLYELRWFTPSEEIDLCGHATLASAAVILGIREEIPGPKVVFFTRSGELGVDRRPPVPGTGLDLYVLDFPARDPAPRPADLELAGLLGVPEEGFPCAYLQFGQYILCVFKRAEQVRALAPRLEHSPYFTVVATAPGQDCDFVSRTFVPGAGIPEDPVTGSSHTMLIPYWSSRLGKNSLFARQISPRGGELWCENRGPRVSIGGHVVPFLEGQIEIPDGPLGESRHGSQA